MSSIFANVGSPLPSIYDKENAPPTPLNTVPFKLGSGTPNKGGVMALHTPVQNSMFDNSVNDDTEESFSSSLATRLAREVGQGHKSAEELKATIARQEATIARGGRPLETNIVDESVNASVLDCTTASDCNQSFTDELTEGLVRELATVHKGIDECKTTLANNERTIVEMKGLPVPEQKVEDLNTTAMTEGESFVGELNTTNASDGNESFTGALTGALTREVAEATKALDEFQRRVAASQSTIDLLQDGDNESMLDATVDSVGNQSFTETLTAGLARELATVHQSIDESKRAIADNEKTIAEMKGLPVPEQEVEDLDTTAMMEGESFVGELNASCDGNESFTEALTGGLAREVAEAHKTLAACQATESSTEAIIAQLRGLAGTAPADNLDETAMTEGESMLDATVGSVLNGSVLEATSNQSFTDELMEGLTREVAVLHGEIEGYKATIARNEVTIAKLQ